MNFTKFYIHAEVSNFYYLIKETLSLFHEHEILIPQFAGMKSESSASILQECYSAFIVSDTRRKVCKLTQKVSEATHKVSEATHKVFEVTQKVSEATQKISEITQKVSEITQKASEITQKVSEVTQKV